MEQTWDLDVFFPGGSSSETFDRFLKELQQEISSFRELVCRPVPAMSAAQVEHFAYILEQTQFLMTRMREAGAFVTCLNAQDVHDQEAKQLSGRISQLTAANVSALALLDQQWLHLSESVWEALLRETRVAPIAFSLRERRARAAEKLPIDQELLVTDLSVDGYHAWSDIYNAVIGNMSIPVERHGDVIPLSVGQAANQMQVADRAIRVEMFGKWEQAFAKQEELFASTLNHLAGFRLQVYRHRGWDSVLREPLQNNRMTEATLSVMWRVVERHKEVLASFLRRKGRLLGTDTLSWHDAAAPVGHGGEQVTFAQARALIVEQFGRFSPEMAAFADKCFKERWIEALDRPGKRPGGFCTSFPVANQSRIFMTFSGSVANVATLAHELGHAYHQYTMHGIPPMSRQYAMNVAETASTFAEMIVADAALRQTSVREERLALLDGKARRAVTFFMDIHARFLFELDFYAARKDGLVGAKTLNDMMERAQKEAFLGVLDEYHPRYWASKMHFYMTHSPFYNFPYTFGYLFSAGVYRTALSEGQGFADRYVALLRDTGRMTVEDLAKAHLGVDLTKDEFWESAVKLVLQDAEEFLRLTDQDV